MSSEKKNITSFSIISEDGKTVYKGNLEFVGDVARWNKGIFYVGIFSDFDDAGTFRISIDGAVSERFEVCEYLTNLRLLNANTYYFKAQRDTGEWLSEDSHLTFNGPRKGTIDLHGGWFDASGDHGIHLSHLSHSTYYNPQQMGLSVYAFFKAYEFIAEKNNPSYTILGVRMIDEGSWGADWLMRCHAPSGAFFRSIRRHEDLNNLTVIKGTRHIGFEYHGSSDQFSKVASTADDEHIDDTNYEASLRSGGAVAIAALAIAGRHYTSSTEYTVDDYLNTAISVYDYMVENNEKYTNDGKWNFNDYFTTLIAAVELYKSTKNPYYLSESRKWADKVVGCTASMGKDRRRFEFVSGMPYQHASDEGLPIFALLLYLDIEEDKNTRNQIITICEEVMRHKIALSKAINNPFFYPVEEVKVDGKEKTQFFFPHKTTVSPWWQGEDARLASISTACSYLARYTSDDSLKVDLLAMSASTLDWIMGQNPFDASMIEGFGRNNPQYFFFDRFDYLNCPGGIVNGITSGLEDEEGIDLIGAPREGISDNWRWAEQWIPHVTWFILAKSIRVK